MDNILMLYDPDTGRLSQQSVNMIHDWRKIKSGGVECCAAPNWVVDYLVRALLPVVEQGEASLVQTQGPSVPVICFNCENCGFVASYLAEMIFPGWRDLQAPPAP